MHYFPKITAVTSLMILSACGGSSGGSGGPTAATDFLLSGPDSADITGAFAGDDGTETVTGTLNRANQTLDLGSFSGSINDDGSEVTDGTTTLVIADTDTDFVRVYDNGTNTGVFGAATAIADLPGGTASYDGTGGFVLIDDTGIYDLSGDATSEVDFGTGTLTTTVANLSGTLDTGTAATANVSDAGTLSLTDMQIADNAFSGGALSLESTVITSTATPTASASATGNFFGPNGEEIGGVFSLDDRTAGEQLLFGTFVGQQ